MSKNPYFVFLLKAVLLVALLFATDKVVGLLIERYFLKMKVGTAAATTYALDKANEDLIIFGSSRALHHYVPRILQDSLRMTAYNAGRDGMTMLYSYAVFQAMLKRFKPHAIILDVFLDFNTYDDAIDRLSALSPYYKRHPEIRPIVNLRGPYEGLKASSSLYNYNSSLFTVLANNIIKRQDRYPSGYIPLTTSAPPRWTDFDFPNNSLDTVKVKYFVNFLEEARKANVEVIIVVSPYYGTMNNPLAGLRWVQRYCIDNGFHFRDYSQSTYFRSHPELFSDNAHLNDKGARVFTQTLSSDIKRNYSTWDRVVK